MPPPPNHKKTQKKTPAVGCAALGRTKRDRFTIKGGGRAGGGREAAASSRQRSRSGAFHNTVAGETGRDGTGVNNRAYAVSSLCDRFRRRQSPRLFITERQHKAGPVPPRRSPFVTINPSFVCFLLFFFGGGGEVTGQDGTGRDGTVAITPEAARGRFA